MRIANVIDSEMFQGCFATVRGEHQQPFSFGPLILLVHPAQLAPIDALIVPASNARNRMFSASMQMPLSFR